MNIKLDENMPLRLAGILADLGHQTDTVPQESPMCGCTPRRRKMRVRGLACFTLSPLHPLTPSFLREGLAGRDDAEVWEAAQESESFLITQDLDFSDIRRFTPGTHHGLLLVRLRDPGRDALAQKVRTVFQTEDVENWKGCFVVATERKIRVRRPEAP